jgi:phosphoribosylaminoimidazolecarboxamide formyltransferase/IMP cyclohydrolase
MPASQVFLAAGPDLLTVRRALISVSDKTGIEDAARAMTERGVEIISTGGTARTLREAGIPVTEVRAVTGAAEMMEGRVKTLHPGVHGAILARRDDPGDMASLQSAGTAPIDCLLVNLYPFEETVAAGADPNTVIETIDVGGPAMIRAAAKNAAWVAVITDPADYAAFVAALRGGGIPRLLRLKLAAKAFARTAAYDAAIAAWHAAQLDQDTPEQLLVSARLRDRLRYGENPHQSAALYLTDEAGPSIARARQVQGKPLSHNNISDADAAFELVCDLPSDRAAVAIIKHANPCGAALGADVATAYGLALLCDPQSAYGGIVAVNRPLDEASATLITAVFTEVVVAPDADAGAIAAFARKPNLRLLLTGGLADPRAAPMQLKSIAGGLLLQQRDAVSVRRGECRVVTRRTPTSEEMADLIFAFRVAKHVKSNAIVYARNGATVGIGAGQMSRVDSVRIAALKGAEAARVAGINAPLTRGSVVASDAFFPFADGLIAAVEAGATAVIQPGGSLRDGEVIAAADEAGLAMVFTDVRHFRH